jgi:endonuclease III related protein
MTTREAILRMHDLLLAAYGSQKWWPAETPFEVMVGAVLTQNTNWRNVEKAIANLKSRGALSPAEIRRLPMGELAELIRPAGYYNVKAKRLSNLVRFVMDEYDGDLAAMRRRSLGELREGLMGVSGVGRETCDSILLYALDKATFVVDAYTARVLHRHGLIDETADYDEIKETFESSLPEDARLFNEYHALLVQVGKKHCRPRPICESCPLDALFSSPRQRPQPLDADDEEDGS